MGYIVSPFPRIACPLRRPLGDFLIYHAAHRVYAGHNDGIAVTNDTPPTSFDYEAGLHTGLGFNAIEPLPITTVFCDLNGAGRATGRRHFASETLTHQPRPAVAELHSAHRCGHTPGHRRHSRRVYNPRSHYQQPVLNTDGTCGDNGVEGGILLSWHPLLGCGFASGKQE